MSPFRWVLLCIFFTLYLLLGGSIFMLIEQRHEVHQKEELNVLRQDIKEILFRLDHNFYSNWTNPDVLEALTSAKEGVINRIAQTCGIDNLLEDTGRPAEPTSLKWNYYNSVFFAFTVVTTIGYGHLSPSTSLSKSLMMIYALFGIPLNGILLSGVGDYFSNKLVRVHQKSKDKKYRGKSLTLVFEIIFYLIPGIVVFIIIPAGIFVLIENWTFLDSVYFAFVSLTTIGFGDYVAGMGDGHNIWLWLYKAFIIIWITFGLGYLIMILGFIAKGMKSKKVRGVLEKRLTGIKNTKEKLSKDIDYMRRIVNELYLMKIKPAYEAESQEQQTTKDDNDISNTKRIKSRRPSFVYFERRCSSLPRLPIRGEGAYDFENNGGRLESHSQAITASLDSTDGAKEHLPPRRLVRRLSESDALHVERDEAFMDLRRGSISPEELLFTVVNALNGNMRNVMEAVDVLNKYEQQVEDEKNYGGSESPEESDDLEEQRSSCDLESSGHSLEKPQNLDLPVPISPWELRAVSESDEEVLIEGNKVEKQEQLHSVVVHKTPEPASQSFMERVSDAIRKISGTKTPPETPSRKISRIESERKRKISRMESSEKVGPGIHRHHHPHHYSQYSPFVRRPSSRRPSDADGKHLHYQKHHTQRQVPDLRKTSQESRISTLSDSSYQTIDEIVSSVRASRKTTPAHYHPSSPMLYMEDEVDANGNCTANHSGRVSLEASTSSLAHLLKALDTVQDRLQKSSMGSEVSYSGSHHFSDHSDAVDLSSSFAPSSSTTPISSRGKKLFTSTESILDRKRKNGVFQPGFSYVNFGYNPDEDDEDLSLDPMGRRTVTRRGDDEFSKTNPKFNDSSSTSKKR